jgi:uncharacterized tellurite resistance protein B-like protein
MKSIPELNERITSFACVISALIASDEKVTSKEHSHVVEFFDSEFGIDQAGAEALIAAGRNDIEKLDEHIALLKGALQDHGNAGIRFMRFLNTCIACDGVDNREYEIFDKIKAELF